MSINDARRWWRYRTTAVAVTAVTAGLAAAGMLMAPGRVAWAWIGLTSAIGLSFTAMGGLVLAGVPKHPVGRLMTGAGVVACVAAVAASWTVWTPLAWLSQWIWCPPFGLILLAMLVFPNGALPSRRWRPVAAGIAVATAAAATGLAVAALEPPHTVLTNIEPPTTAWGRLAVRVTLLATLLMAIGLVAVVGSLWHRWRSTTGESRRQVVCLLLAGALLVPSLVLDALGVPGAWLVVAVAVPAAMTLAVVRFRLYRLDRLVNRTFVWLIMSMVVVAAFVAIVAMLRAAFFQIGVSAASLAATAVIAVVFEPVRGRVQRTINHLLYGDRDSPYEVVARLAEVAGRTTEQIDVLPRLVETLARSLQLPFVAIETAERGVPKLVAQHGEPTGTVEAFDMLTHGQHLGRLLVAPRSYGAHFSRRERRLLTDVSLHAAAAVEATQLVRELQDSRERLVIAREEERRRLRRDLHDGLGPAIAGMSMQVRAVRDLVAGQQRAVNLLEGLAADLTDCMAEVRQLVDQLRPPALDEGLAAALRAECRRFNSPDLTVTATIDVEPEGLPAAVEVAAYRIVAEALTNVARHSKAKACRVTVTLGQSLGLHITDDGTGIDTYAATGVGLTSMRERAEELGGTCTVHNVTPHGTSVHVRLPVRLDHRIGIYDRRPPPKLPGTTDEHRT